jgi:hypothetical protein
MNKKNLLRFAGLAAVLGSAAHAQTQVSANITTNTQWTTAGSPYILNGIIYVTSGATLDIEPGVVIRGQPKSGVGATDPGTLIIARGSKIQARGTSSDPIIFTTAALDAGKKAGGSANGLRHDGNADGVPDKWTPADGLANFLDQNPASTPLAPVNSLGVSNSQLWGSLVLLGNASVNTRVDSIHDGIGTGGLVDGKAYLEGQNTNFFNEYGLITHTFDPGTGTYTDVTDVVNDDDNSGFLNYVSLRHGGFELTPGKELNGLTLAGVGRGTTVRNIEIYCNSDDGVEIFGGTVNVSYIAVSFVEDDGFDLDQGHRGTAQFVYVAHGLKGSGTSFSSDPRGMELDGDDQNDANGQSLAVNGLPQQNSSIYNATVQTLGQRGVVMRRGFRGELVNSIIAQGGIAAETGIEIAGFTVAPSTNVQQSYADRLLNVRNTTVNNYSTGSTSITATPALAGVPNVGVSTSFVATSNTGTNPGTSPTFFYAAPLNNALGAALFPNTTNNTANPDLLAISIAASGFNPRPGSGPGNPSVLATGGVQNSAYVRYPAVFTTYKGAFNASAPTLWTTGWTAVNKTNTNGIKLLVD